MRKATFSHTQYEIWRCDFDGMDERAVRMSNNDLANHTHVWNLTLGTN
jgi:hypothetical protein